MAYKHQHFLRQRNKTIYKVYVCESKLSVNFCVAFKKNM